MSASRLLIGLLLAATMLVDVVAGMSFFGGPGFGAVSWPHPALGVLFALAFSQVGLASIWAAAGRSQAAWRLSGCVLAVTAWSTALATLYDEPVGGYNSTQWVALLLGQAVVTLVPLSVARIGGLRLKQADRPDSSPRDIRPEGRWQFSLACLLAWMTATAVVLGTIQYAVQPGFLPLVPYVWLDAGILIVAHSAMAMVGLWAVLGVGQAIGRVAAASLTAAVVVTLYGTLPKTRAHAAVLVLMGLVQLALLFGSLGVVRVAGYRWQR